MSSVRTEQKNVTADRAYSMSSEKSETALVERRMRLKFASGFMRMLMATIMAGSRGIVQKSAFLKTNSCCSSAHERLTSLYG